MSNTYSAFVIPVVGDEFEVTASQDSVADMQALVSGFVEAVKLGDLYLLVDEDGDAKNLPANARATRLVEVLAGALLQPLLGQVAFVSENHEDASVFADVPDSLISIYDETVKTQTF